MVAANEGERLDWVVLVYRIPREPSSPRIAIWRKLRSLGAGQLVDGVAALPEDARTREHLEWVADQVLDAGGTSLLLRAQALARKDERTMARRMAEARAEEYRRLTADACALKGALSTVDAAESDQTRALKRLRKAMRTVGRRDYFPPPERNAAVIALNDLAAAIAARQSASREPLHSPTAGSQRQR